MDARMGVVTNRRVPHAPAAFSAGWERWVGICGAAVWLPNGGPRRRLRAQCMPSVVWVRSTRSGA